MAQKTITFKEARDLGPYGMVAAGESRSDLPEEYAGLQVQYGFADEEPATPLTGKKNKQQED